MERRELFKILTTTAVGLDAAMAQHTHAAKAAAAATGPPRFFSEDQRAAVDALCDVILPSDELSPGASAAQVWRYVDLTVAYGNKAAQTQFVEGLRRFDEAAQAKFGRKFAALNRDQQDALVGAAAAKETDAADPMGRFFATLKLMTIMGFHCSEIGMKQFMHYEGNTAAAEFTGCNHPEHKQFAERADD